MRVRTAPPKGIRFAKPESSRFRRPAGYECSVWICKNLVVVIVNLSVQFLLIAGNYAVPLGSNRARYGDGLPQPCPRRTLGLK